MADASVSFKGAAAPINPGAAQTAQAPRSSAPAEAKSIVDVFSLCAAPSTLSKEGEAYVEKVLSTLIASGRPAKQHKVVGANYEARVIECGEVLEAFIFAETYSNTADPTPIAGVRNDFQNAMTAAGLDPAKLDQFLIITKEDYEKVDIMASFITNAMMTQDNKLVRELSASAFAGGNFRITTDIAAVRDFVEKTYPLKTLPRMDSGMLLYVTKPIENAFDHSGRPEMQRIPILAVTGYTDFEYYNSGNMYGAAATKYTPIFVTTGVHSRLVSPKIAVAGMALASYIFIRRMHWLEPFSTFQKGSPDIGNLVQDEKGKLVHAANLMDRDLVVERALSSRLPLMGLDIQLGAPAMSGLTKIVKDTAAFNHIVDSFTGGSGASQSQRPFQVLAFRFDGRVKINKAGLADYVDTRCVDYLHLVQSIGVPGDAADMLQPTLEPKTKCDALKRFYPDAQLLYITHRLILNPVYIEAVAGDLGQSLKVQIEGAYAPNTYEVSQLAMFQPTSCGMQNFMLPSNGNPFSGGFFF